MPDVLRSVLLIAAFIGAPSTASAADPLMLEDVLDALEQTHPTLEATRNKRDAAEGKALSARGGFDPKLAVKGKWVPVGYYETTQLDASIEQATPIWGASVYGGYRFGWGNFPVYKGDLQTREYGELRAGLDVPIWQGGPIDPRRAKIAATKAQLRGADAQVDATVLALQQEAADAYWTWVATGQALEVADGLLELAKTRQNALDAQVEAGLVEGIKKVDNRRLVLSREAKIVEARQKFDKASIDLSLYYRDGDQRPLRPDEEQLPAVIPSPARPSEAAIPGDVSAALDRRPELSVLEAEREAAEVGVKLAKNQRSPDASVQAFVAKDFGPGPAELYPAEFGVGFVLSVPIPLRKARGELQTARAELSSVRAKTRGTSDKIEAEIRKAFVGLVAAHRSWELAQAQAEAAEVLAEAERKRFFEGATDLVVVNLRELAVAEAQVAVIDASADYQRAMAEYRVATGRSPTSR